jgi:hypothetical protein
MTRSLLLACIVVIGVALIPSCLFVKAPEQKPRIDTVALSPQPEIEMSEELIRTRAGDMIAVLPKGWVLLDATSTPSVDVIAVAVNTEYTLSAVFSEIPQTEAVADAVKAEGIKGLARAAFARHQRKTGSAVKLYGDIATADLGARQFALYEFTPASGALRTRCAVFTSAIGKSYEFALVPMTVSGKELPVDAEQQRIFRSILTTVQY